MDNGAQKVWIDFEPVGLRVQVETGLTILEAAGQAGIELVSVCGGMGTCAQCQVRIVSGSASPLTETERAVYTPAELEAGWRLACQAQLTSSGQVAVPADSLTAPQRMQIEGIDEAAAVETCFSFLELQLDEPDLQDLRSDDVRLRQAIGLSEGAPVPYRSLQRLPDLLRGGSWKVGAALRDGQLVGLLPAGSRPLGLAVDLGTTKLAAYLLDLTSGEILGRASAMNPQIHNGEDVISRIHYSMERPDGAAALQAAAVGTINQLAAELCAGQDCETDQIVEAVIVGNTAMHHLLSGLPVRQLGLSPYIPAVSQALELEAECIGLRLAPGAVVYLPPNIAGYVGGDHVAMLLACDAHLAKDTLLAIDIGTNTEISLFAPGVRLCCSCASGPCFEGAHIRDGMRASAGAIERVQIEAGQVRCHTIHHAAPIGICGSGILDAVAEMLGAGIVNRRGALAAGAPGVRGAGKDTEFLLVPAGASGSGRDIGVSRKDISEILLAKAAIRSGIDVLLEAARLRPEQIDRFVVAGAFGTYLSIPSAVRTGMFPDLPASRFQQVGNAAGSGARRMLLSSRQRAVAEELARTVHYIELTAYPGFRETYINALQFA